MFFITSTLMLLLAERKINTETPGGALTKIIYGDLHLRK